MKKVKPKKTFQSARLMETAAVKLCFLFTEDFEFFLPQAIKLSNPTITWEEVAPCMLFFQTSKGKFAVDDL